jgi:hypothetical protein
LEPLLSKAVRLHGKNAKFIAAGIAKDLDIDPWTKTISEQLDRACGGRGEPNQANKEDT